MSILDVTSRKLKIVNVGSNEVISIYNLVKNFQRNINLKLYINRITKNIISTFMFHLLKLKKILNFKKLTI